MTFFHTKNLNINDIFQLPTYTINGMHFLLFQNIMKPEKTSLCCHIVPYTHSNEFYYCIMEKKPIKAALMGPCAEIIPQDRCAQSEVATLTGDSQRRRVSNTSSLDLPHNEEYPRVQLIKSRLNRSRSHGISTLHFFITFPFTLYGEMCF